MKYAYGRVVVGKLRFCVGDWGKLEGREKKTQRGEKSLELYRRLMNGICGGLHGVNNESQPDYTRVIDC